MLISRPRLAGVLISPMKMTAPVMKAAEPTPAMNRYTSSGARESAVPASALPTAAISGPPISTARRPNRSERTAVGMLVRNRASPKTLMTRPTVAMDTPRLSA